MIPSRRSARATGAALLAALTLAACATPGTGTDTRSARPGPPPSSTEGAPRVAADAMPGPPLASSAAWCDRARVHDADRQDRLLRFAALVRGVLDASDHEVAVVSRTGIDLERIGVRFSHAGVAIRRGGDVPWTVRQLYYACDEARPGLYDQGIAGFLFNTDDPGTGHVSIVFPSRERAARLADAARDRVRALRLLAARYSANAYAYSVRYQNCNQWVIELMAAGWGGLADGADLRERAQGWLAAQGYDPAPLVLDSHWLKFAASFSPMVHLDDHPPADRHGLRFTVSLPESIETFVRTVDAGATRIELCHAGDTVVVRSGWRPIAKGCIAEPGDRTASLAR
ncbi:MAG: DUF2145 domain-containing protein [Lautropia sp.]